MTNPTNTKRLCGCGRTATAGYLCSDCSDQLASDLRSLQWMLPELTTLLTRQVATHGGSSRRPATMADDLATAVSTRVLSKSEMVALVPHPIPFDEAASIMLAEARGTLGGICRARGAHFNALTGAA